MKVPVTFKPQTNHYSLWRWLLIALCLVGFAALAKEAHEGGISAIDQLALSLLHTPDTFSANPPWVQVLTRDVTALGGFTVLSLICIFAVALMLVYRQHRQAAVFALTVILSQALTEGLKAMIARPRPVLLSQADIVYSSSFPSGHATMSTVVYLTLAMIICRSSLHPSARALTLGAAIILVLAIGITRIELGVHWPTDVLAGWLLGSAIALAVSPSPYES